MRRRRAWGMVLACGFVVILSVAAGLRKEPLGLALTRLPSERAQLLIYPVYNTYNVV